MENTTDDGVDVYTFFDSTTWGVFYAYNQVLVILTIVVSSYFIAKEVKLEYTSYKFQNDIHTKLGHISIAIGGLHKKYKYQRNKTSRNSQPYNKVKDLTPEMVIDTIDVKFNEMQQILENHKHQLKNQVLKMTEKAQEKEKRQKKDDSPGLTSGLHRIASNVPSGTELTLAGIVGSDETEHKTEVRQDDLGLTTQMSKEICSKDIEKTRAEIHPIVSKYITSKHNPNTNEKQGLKKFLSVVWSIRKIMFMASSHVFDTASDIALAVEWYILYQKQEFDETGTFLNEYNLDMRAMFFCCISIILYYRLSSSWEIYKFTHSFSDTFLQFLFDFYLIKLIYINVFKMKSYSPLKILRIMRSIEGQNESGFQSIVTMVFLIKTNFGQFGDNSNIIPILSFIFSFWSLNSRFIFLDFNHLKPNAQAVGLNVNDLNCTEINIWYIFHALFRLIEVLFSILVISLIWVQIGLGWVVVVIVSLYLWLVLQQKLRGNGLVFHNNFLAKLMVFDISQICVGFNLKAYYPYGKYSSRAARLLFLCLGCWLLFVRVLLCCVIGLHSYSEGGNTDKNDATFYCIMCSIILIFIWFIMFFVAIQCYINRDRTFVSRTGSNVLNGFDIIKSDDRESIIFCKELNIDVFTYPNYKKYDSGLNKPNNVLESMIISGDIENYTVIEEWFNCSGMKHKMKCDFVHFLKQLPWDGYTMRKLVYNCNSLDS